MTKKQMHVVVTLLIATVWIAFGLFCKVLDFVPRHEEIVARILGVRYAGPITRGIGVLEVMMGLWVLSGLEKEVNAIAQMTLIGIMNLTEAILVPDLLLWGRLNAVFALALIAVIYVNVWKLGERANE